jgi:hypothetical protein
MEINNEVSSSINLPLTFDNMPHFIRYRCIIKQNSTTRGIKPCFYIVHPRTIVKDNEATNAMQVNYKIKPITKVENGIKQTIPYYSICGDKVTKYSRDIRQNTIIFTAADYSIQTLSSIPNFNSSEKCDELFEMLENEEPSKNIIHFINTGEQLPDVGGFKKRKSRKNKKNNKRKKSRKLH